MLVTLGEDPSTDSLYGFCRADNPRGKRFSPEREVELEAGSGRTLKVAVPPRMRVPLPGAGGVAAAGLLRIEPLGDRLDTLFLLSLRAGWNQTEEDVRRLTSFDPEGCLVALIDAPGGDIPAGTAALIPLGTEAAWIGMVLVHPELRRQGIAGELMKACLRRAEERRMDVVGLDATPEGCPVYEALGFAASFGIWRTVFPLGQLGASGAGPGHAGVQEAVASDLTDIERYDAGAGFDRSSVLAALMRSPDSRAFLLRGRGGGMAGYCLTRPGRLRPFIGPLVADSTEAARALLEAAALWFITQGHTHACMDMPEHQLLLASCERVRPFTRMYLAPGQRPDARRFMERERDVTAARTFGTSGPEKG